MFVYNKSSIGYSHIKNKKPCQDYSASYQDMDKIIITCCDGHGGKSYIRSNRGSHMASNAIMEVFNIIDLSGSRSKLEEFLNSVKLMILCSYNRQVEEDLSHHPITKRELEGLSEQEIFNLKENKTRAYGTTLAGAMIKNNKLIIASIGDTECFLLKKGNLEKAFNTDDDPAANFTYSMCQEDAFNYLRVGMYDLKDIDGVLLSTDGLTSPYSTYTNFKSSFLYPFLNKLESYRNSSFLNEEITDLSTSKGTGDDVSLSFIIKENMKSKRYK